MNKDIYCGICKYLDKDNPPIDFKYYCNKHHTYKDLCCKCKGFKNKN